MLTIHWQNLSPAFVGLADQQFPGDDERLLVRDGQPFAPAGRREHRRQTSRTHHRRQNGVDRLMFCKLYQCLRPRQDLDVQVPHQLTQGPLVSQVCNGYIPRPETPGLLGQ